MTGEEPRVLLRRDLHEVLEVERSSFSSPWSAGMLALELERDGAFSIGVERAGRLVGFAICVDDGGDWTLLRIAVRPECRREGVAARLMGQLIRLLPEGARITLEVRESNAAAIGFYSRHGFLIAGRRRGYYPDNGEDGLIMWRTEGTLRGSLEDVPGAGAPAG